MVVIYVFKFPLLMTGKPQSTVMGIRETNLCAGLAILVTFTWPIGITTTIDTFLHSPPYLFDTIQASSMRFAGVIGALCGMSL